MIPAANKEQEYSEDYFEADIILFGDDERNDNQLCRRYHGGGAHHVTPEGDSGQSTTHHVMLPSFRQQQPGGRLKIRRWVDLADDVPFLERDVVTSHVSPAATGRSAGAEKARPQVSRMMTEVNGS